MPFTPAGKIPDTIVISIPTKQLNQNRRNGEKFAHATATGNGDDDSSACLDDDDFPPTEQEDKDEACNRHFNQVMASAGGQHRFHRGPAFVAEKNNQDNENKIKKSSRLRFMRGFKAYLYPSKDILRDKK
jgi:hypothetical protein